MDDRGTAQRMPRSRPGPPSENGDIYRYNRSHAEIEDFFQSGWSVLAVGAPHPVVAGAFKRLRSGNLPTHRDQGPRRSPGGTLCPQLAGRRLLGTGR